MAYECKVLADSVSPLGVRLTTIQATFPRIILAEVNTHRMLSRNSASSRAIPVEKMLQRVMEDPFIPIYWGKNQKGMQAERELTEEEQTIARGEWLGARDEAVFFAKRMLSQGVHKQITNRLLEPWLWHTAIISATEWANLWALRCHKDAQPEFRVAAEMWRETIAASTPRPLSSQTWHLPLVTDEERRSIEDFDWRKVSIGRCARVSYLTHDGRRAPEEDIQLCDRLIQSGHMSPTEHVARPAGPWAGREGDAFVGNFRGWVQYRKLLPNEDVFQPPT